MSTARDDTDANLLQLTAKNPLRRLNDVLRTRPFGLSRGHECLVPDLCQRRRGKAEVKNVERPLLREPNGLAHISRLATKPIRCDAARHDGHSFWHEPPS